MAVLLVRLNAMLPRCPYILVTIGTRHSAISATIQLPR
jgi:hypothetical protein